MHHQKLSFILLLGLWMVGCDNPQSVRQPIEADDAYLSIDFEYAQQDLAVGDTQTPDAQAIDAQVALDAATTDPCATDNGGCAQTCLNDAGTFACACTPGYVLNADGRTCDDIDECATDNGGCAQTCLNDAGTFACACTPGYSLNPDELACDDIDECATDNGGCAQTCNNDAGTFACACTPGYSLNPDELACDDIDECANDNAGCAQTCLNDAGTFACACNSGYVLNADGLTCDDVDECATDNGGCAQTCTNDAGTFNCDCNAGYVLNADGLACDDIDECATDNGGCAQTCTNDAGTFNCDCNAGYVLNADGVACDDIDECANDNAGCAQTCTNNAGTFACACTPGYSLNPDELACDDIDECANDNAGCAQTCTNNAGTFACACTPGYVLNADGRTCDDIDECATDNGGCAQTCNNDAGTFACACTPGYSLNPDELACDDIDECANDNAGCAQTCTNNAGTFACACTPGYVLNADELACDDIDECATDNGGCAHTCTNDAGTFACACNDDNACTDDLWDAINGCQHPELPFGTPGCTTNWSVINETLYGKRHLLPYPPSEPLEMTWPSAIPELRIDTLSAHPVPENWQRQTGCWSGLWDETRISVGSTFSIDGTDGCWASVGTGSYAGGKNIGSFYFGNRHGSLNNPIVGDPAWVQARFPVPPGHYSRKLDVVVEKPRLFGFEPSGCHEQYVRDDGSCDYDTSEPWTETDAGLYMLWSRPGADSYIITGPLLPSTSPLSWNRLTFSPEVPEALRDATELVVTLFVYRQYPRECLVRLDNQTGEPLLDDDGNPLLDCVDGYAGYNLELQSVSLETRATSISAIEPALDHPRLFGTNAQWLADQVPFESMPCIEPERFTGETAVVGGLEDIKSLWDMRTLGVERCSGEAIPRLADHLYVERYLQNIEVINAQKAADEWESTRTIVLHAIRRTKACLSGPTPDDCQATPEELASIIQAFKTVELADFDDITWCYGGFCFNGGGEGYGLRTGPKVYEWSLFVDVLWDDLTPTEHAQIKTRLSQLIDYFLEHGENRHWALFNGNNWTPALVMGSLAWAITYYYEDPRALDVIILSLGTMFLHRDYWSSDGVYTEGISYGYYSIAPMETITHLLKRALGVVPQFLIPSHIEKAGDWYQNTMAPDGWTLDFGDAHSQHGWKSHVPLSAVFVNEWALDEPSAVDPCLAKDYWANKYYFHGFIDPWNMPPWMARDWQSIIAQCVQTPEQSQRRIYPEGGYAILKSILPGSSGLTDELPANHKGHNADVTYLAASFIPNGNIHMESDFGTLIWSAFGTRMIADIGYGSQSLRPYLLYYNQGGNHVAVDNNPVGHSTLYVPEATIDLPNGFQSNTSQIAESVGTVMAGRWGDFDGIHMDGAYVYGKVAGNPVHTEAQAHGWLEAFDRWLITIPGGHFLVIDSMLKRADRPNITASETWQFSHDPPDAPTQACRYKDVHVQAQTLENRHIVELRPRCSRLFKEMSSTAVGYIVGASRVPGEFTDPQVFETYRNNGGMITHKRVRYVPNDPFEHDARVFALIAAPNEESIPSITLDAVQCDDLDNACFELTIASDTYIIEMPWDGSRHSLGTVNTVD